LAANGYLGDKVQVYVASLMESDCAILEENSEPVNKSIVPIYWAVSLSESKENSYLFCSLRSSIWEARLVQNWLLQIPKSELEGQTNNYPNTNLIDRQIA